MPSGACVIRYEGARGITWKIKYTDADGRQVKETVGREPEWDRRKAERALGARLADVQRGMRKPKRRTFADLAIEFEEVALPARPRKKTTVESYKMMLRLHLRPAFDHQDLQRLSQSPQEFDRYIGSKLGDGLSSKTIRNHLVLLHLMFRKAREWRWVPENPLELIEPPPADETETETVTPAEVDAMLRAWKTLEATADEADRHWYATGRRMVVVALSTGLRRGELLGMRWRDVELLERRLTVNQSFVRGEMTSPKSRAGRRRIEFGSVAAAALEEQFQASPHRSPDSIVFCHPALGTPLDPSKLSACARKAIAAAGVEKRFRPWHGLRHTALTETAAAGVPAMFVQARAGHAQGSTTERYLHAAKTAYPEVAELAEARLFGTKSSTT